MSLPCGKSVRHFEATYNVPFGTPQKGSSSVSCMYNSCCALCPFKSTFQRFDMVQDAWNLVELTNYIPFVYMLAFYEFCNIFHWEFHVSICGPIFGRSTPLGGGTTIVLVEACRISPIRE